MNAWFRRLPDYNETTDAIAMVERAIAERRVVKVMFFKERGGWFRDSLDAVFGRRKMLQATPVTRTVEPLSWDVNADGEPYMDVISWESPGEEYPAARRIRIDRIAVTSRGIGLRFTGQAFRVAGTALDPTRVTA